jgi:regulator of protease activity HflC (stomatin/prohibitin superfamily)
MNRLMRFVAIAALALGLSACNNVPNGFVGVQFNKFGDDRGVDSKVLDPGRYMAGWNTSVELLPTFTQADMWTARSEESKKPDQSIQFQVAGGIGVSTDIQISYHVEKANAIKVFQKYRQPIDVISDSFLRTFVRDEFNEAGTKYDVESLQGDGKAKLLKEVNDAVIKRAATIGITVESISYLGKLHFPDNVVASINAKIQATQDAMKVENEVRRTKAEQEKVVVTAQAQVEVAQAEAKAIELRGQAYRNNPQVMQMEIARMQAEALRDTKIQYLGTMPTMFKSAQ